MIRSFENVRPNIHPTAFVHPSSEVIGRVILKKNASVWPMVVLRGDIETITIGVDANVQDATVMHTSKGLPVVLETGVTIGHGVIVHGAKIGAYSLIGMGAILLDGCQIGKECLIGAGAVVPEQVRIPPRSLVLGIPGKVVRKLRPDELKLLHNRAKDYVRYAAQHKKTSRPL
jgi:carbonic anhydrase/acetyltransferase-like protein (isoleucine patch superfamily)